MKRWVWVPVVAGTALGGAVWSCGDFSGPDNGPVIVGEKRECPPGHQKQGWCVPDMAYAVVSPDSAEVYPDSTAQFEAHGYDAWDNELTVADTLGNPIHWRWGVTDSATAAIDSTGLATGIAEGKTYVVAWTDGVRDSAVLVVLTALPPPPPPPDTEPAYVVVSPDSVTVKPDSTAQLGAQAYTASDSAVDAEFTWLSRDTLTARVDTAGLVTGIAEGEAFVLATLGALADSAVVTVVSLPPPPPPPDTTPAYVVVSPDSIDLALDSTAQLTAQAYTASDSAVDAAFVWLSRDTLVARVDTFGSVTGAGGGRTYVVAMLDSLADSATVVVTSPPPPPDTVNGYVVATNGSDANPGTLAEPWRHVGHGMLQLNPGDTLYVRGGTYVEDIQSPGIQQGTPAARIVVMAYPGERPVIQGLLWLTRPSYWTLNGINVTWNPANTSGDHMVKMTRGVGWVYENAEIWDAPSMAGILVYGYGDGEPRDWVIRGNCIHDTYDLGHSTNHDHNLYVNTGIDAGPGLIERNILFNAFNGQNVKLGYGSGGGADHGTVNVTVRYNTMATSRIPFLVSDHGHDNTVYRNIVLRGSEAYAIRAYNLDGANNFFDANIFGDFDYLQYADQDEVTIGPNNLYPYDPQLDGIGCDLMHPQDVTAQAYGRYADETLPPPPPPPPPSGAHYVAPSGNAGAAGTAADPWDLGTALQGGGGAVEPGDTIWLRGGTYRGTFRSTLTGAPGAPVVVRAYPGERAAVEGDGSGTVLTIDGGWATFWGLEIYDSSLDRINERVHLVYVRNTHDLKLINLVVRDGGNALYTDRGAANVEIYGSIFYNNGWQSTIRTDGHAIYIKNDAGWKEVSENILFNQYGYNIHAYSNAGSGDLRNLTFRGNVSFNAAGLNSDPSASAQNILVGGQAPADNVVVADNLTYYSPGIGRINVRLGFGATANGSIELRDNYVAGGDIALRVREWDVMMAHGNTILNAGLMVDLDDGTLGGYSWQSNAYSAPAGESRWRAQGTTYDLAGWQAATGLGNGDVAGVGFADRVFVRPNAYEPDRGHVIVYNWSDASAVDVDLSPILEPGDVFMVHSVYDLWGSPVLSGTYGGGVVSLPMQDLPAPMPIGGSVAPSTGRRFGVFVVHVR